MEVCKISVLLISYLPISVFRGEKLYFTKGNPDNRADRHLRRFCWWMVCLVLLAGAITVAALIGGKIESPG